MAESAGWASYEQRLVPLFATPFLPMLVRAIDQSDPALIVDMACGTGATARGLRDAYPNVRIVAIDVDPTALAPARKRSLAGLAWVCASATELPFPAATVDVLVCQQGLQFMPLQRVARAAATTLRPGGQLVGLSWCPSSRQPVFAALHEIAGRFGWADPDRFNRPCAFDPERFKIAAQQAGLRDVRVEEVSLTLPVTDPQDLLRHWYDHPTAALAEGWRHASNTERRRAEAIFEEALKTPSAMHAYLATARGRSAN